MSILLNILIKNQVYNKTEHYSVASMSSTNTLPPVLAAKAAAELNESIDQYESCFAALRHWLALQPHFKSRTNDEFLLAYLRVAKFSVENAKKRIENFYRHRAAAPELYDNWSITDPKFKRILTSGALLYLPEPIALDGPRVIMIRPSCYDMSQHNSLDVYRTLFTAIDLLIYEDIQAQIAGVIILLDSGNVAKEVVQDFNPFLVRKIINCVNNNVYPARFKAMIQINMPPLLEKVYNLMKNFINAKILERFIVHRGGIESLDTIPRHIFPEEYGGTYDINEMQHEVLRRIEAKAHILQEERNYGMVKGYEAMTKECHDKEYEFGVNGSFKSLSFD